MIFFGHLGITAFIAALLFLPFVVAAIGGILPDIFDKAFFFLGIFPCSRFFGHTLLFVILAGLVTFALTRKKSFAIAISLGSMLHLLQDLQGDVPFLFPFVNYGFFSTCTFDIGQHLNLIDISAEIIGIILLIVLIKYWKQFELLRNKLWSMVR